ncbi:hypothetical protein J2S30_003356 [Herbaspirillum rubrisubalbicans]|nr:hypothetical protein [Herbaspirillum rubrisubalbicans]
MQLLLLGVAQQGCGQRLSCVSISIGPAAAYARSRYCDPAQRQQLQCAGQVALRFGLAIPFLGAGQGMEGAILQAAQSFPFQQ